VQRAIDAGATAVVVAFDPMQWREKRAAEAMTELGPDRYPNQHHLRSCYRQGNVIATEANRIMTMVHELSSWRVAPDRVAEDRAFLRSIQASYLSDLEFVKKGGRVKTYTGNIAANMKAEAARLAERWDRWKDMPALLMLEDREGGAAFPKTAALQGVSRLTMSLQDVKGYRGLDFQAVWILLSKELHVRLTRGAMGLATADWEELRDLHVAVTRAKDELVVFVR
jgi:hypothetical protein